MAQAQQRDVEEGGCCEAPVRQLGQPLPVPGRYGQAGSAGSRRLWRLRWQRDSRGLGGTGASQPRRRRGRGRRVPLPGTPRACVELCVAVCLGWGMAPPSLCAHQQPRDPRLRPLSTLCRGAGHAMPWLLFVGSSLPGFTVFLFRATAHGNAFSTVISLTVLPSPFSLLSPSAKP